MKKYTLILLFISLNAFTQKAFNENEYRKGKKTIVFFHPYMNNENYFKEFALPLIDNFNIVHLRGAKGNNNIYNWYDLDVYSDSFINVSQAKNVIEKTNALLKDFNNIVLVGYSQGGIIANGLMLLNPKKYNRVISINSYINEELINLKKKDFSNVKLIFIYGENDFIISEKMKFESFKFYKKYKINYKKIKHFNYHQIDKKTRDTIIKIIQDGRF